MFADQRGNIGYYTTGTVPIRQQGDGKLPAQVGVGTHEWMGTVPFTKMPHALNPEKGYIVTANNRIVADDSPIF